MPPTLSRLNQIKTLMTSHGIQMFSIDDDDLIQEYHSDVAEQQQEIAPFDTWLTENLENTPGSKFHYHRFQKAYNATVKREKDRIRPNTVRNQLKVRGYIVTSGKGKDSDCCAQPLRCVEGVNVKNWEQVMF